MKEEYGVELVEKINNQYNGIILAVSHQEFKSIDFDKLKLNNNAIIFDTKAFLNRDIVDSRL